MCGLETDITPTVSGIDLQQLLRAVPSAKALARYAEAVSWLEFR